MEVVCLKIYLDNCCYNRPFDVGMVKFMQQFEQGYGDYTAEKYDMPETTMEEVEAFRANEK